MRISKSSKDSVEKILPSKGDLSDREQLIKLASETPAEEKSLSEFGDMKYQEALDRFLDNNPGATEEDFLKAIIRIPLGSGGSAKIIKFSDYKDPAKKVKDIDLASLFTPGKTLASLSSDEREKVNMLLRLTLGKKD